MGGLALGSYIAGRAITGRSDELRIYGILEGVIGLYCLFIPEIIDLFTPFYKGIYASMRDSYFFFSLIRFSISFLILLVPTTLMGATLPILTKYFAQRMETIGGTIGKVYAINTFGAVLGSFGAGFFLLPLFGTSNSILMTAITNITIAVIALLYSRRIITPAVTRAASLDKPLEAEGKPVVLTLLLWGFGLSGFAAMVYQVIWTRMLTLMIGSSTYAFSLIVTAFILGIGFGSIALSRFIDRRVDLLLYFALAQLLIGTSAMFIAYIFGKLPFAVVEIINRFKTSFAMTQFAEFLLVLALLLIPTTLMGVLFPLVSKIFTRSLSMVGRAVGNAYAANTVGAILGSFTGGFIFIPLLGMERGILIAFSLNFLIGFVFILFSQFRTLAFRGALAILWIALSLTFEWRSPAWNKEWITMGPYLYFTIYQRQIEQYGPEIKEKLAKYNRLIYFKEGVSATISVREHVTGERSLQVNGKTDASSGMDMSTQELLAHIPLMLHPEPEDVLIVGLASGVTVGSVEKYPVDRITCVEISPAMVEASDMFRQYNGNALDDPRLTLIIEDGRNHVLLSQDSYDVIISQPTNPWISGVGNLFTYEYFKLLHERLREDGIACVWLQAYGLDPDDFKLIVRTFNEVFPQTTLWESQVGMDYILIGKKTPFRLEIGEIERNFELPGVKADLMRIGVESAPEFLKFMITGPSRLREYAGKGMLHTDDNSRLEFSCPRSLYINTTLLELDAISPFRENPLEFFTGEYSEADRKTCENIIRARMTMVDAVRAMMSGDAVKGEQLLQMSLSYHPGEEEARDKLTRHYATLMIRLIGTGRWEELESLARTTLKLDAENLMAIEALSISLLNRKLYEDAAPFLEKGTRRYPYYAPFHAELGYLYAQVGKAEEAISSYEVAMAMDPRNAEYAFDLGVLYLNSGKPGKAVELFQKAARNEPEFTEAYINLGGTFASLGMLDEAEKAFTRALELDPNNQIALRNLNRIRSR